MNKHSSIKSSGSLLERASEMYDFGAALRGGSAPIPVPPAVEPEQPKAGQPEAAQPIPAAPAPALAPAPAPTPAAAAIRSAMAPAPVSRTQVTISRERLAAHNFIVPDGPVTGLSEEFRIVKRQLLLAARGGKGFDPLPHGERILICSANPDEGKTYSAINLALSMASEKDNRVLLVDADFAKPSILSTLGIEKHRGFMDALADPDCDVESLVLQTDIDGLSILPAGSQTNQDTEYLAASRTAEIIDQLTRNDPARIIIFDSPPALAASPASVLALHVGQTLMVVHADVTTESALRDALSLLSGCENIQLLLNRTKFSPTGRKFGNYYGYGAS
ncbi:MAG: capsular biosynthesis protein [Sphingopyxis sp.]|nr:capsular biosynthesis protein [Sphingopyxis sp.]